jgi:hypothetical protein
MELRIRASSKPKTGPPIRLRPATALLVALLLLLACFAGRAEAGAGDFPSPLYLSGTPSSAVTGSFKLVGNPGPGAPAAAPTVAAIAGGSMPVGSYTYVYTFVGADGETAPSPISNTATTVLGTQRVQVTLPGGLPGGVNVRLYRKRSALFNLVTEVPSSTTTITDNAPDPPSATVLPQSQNRVASAFSPACTATTCGYAEFAPGAFVGTAGNSSPFTAAATPNFARGWLVDTPGPVNVAPGSWTFYVQTKSGVSTTGVAHLAVGLWKVSVSGGSVTSSTLLVDPNSAGEQTATNLINTSNSVQTVSHTVSLPIVSLAAGEHLYVQFWRRQTSPYVSNFNNDARVVTMYAYDGVARIEHPDADDASPGAFSITSPAGGASVREGYSLQSNASDPAPGSGLASVEYFYCLPLADCSFAPNRVSIGSAAVSPFSVAWSGQPADGAYQLVARATDNVGNAVDSGIAPVNVDNTPPETAIDTLPPDPSNGAPSFGFSSGESGTFECRVDGAPFAACSSPHVQAGLASGAHIFAVRAVDLAGNVDATPATHAWTVDATAPTVSFSSTPPDPSTSAAASFSFVASEAATFSCRFDSAVFAACSSPHSLGGIGDGSRTFEVRATDGVGNVGSATYTWNVDATPPIVSFSAAPPAWTSSTAASFGFGANEAATFECRLDGAAYGSCASPQTVSGLADGGHVFDVRATDSVGHVGIGSRTWTVDTVAPASPAAEVPFEGASTASLRLAAVYIGPDAFGSVEFRVCSDAACTNVVALGTSVQVAKGSSASWSIDVALPDGTYYWQARAIDPAGNGSSWTATMNFRRDTTSPGAPGGFSAVLAADGLTLRWTPPAGSDDIGNYVVFVNGSLWRVLGEVTYEAKLGPFDAGDTRTFAVSAVDRAGNEGPRSTTLVGVPDLIGLPLLEAMDAAETRGLVLRELRDPQSQSFGPVASQPGAIVVSQVPAPPALAAQGSTVDVVMGDAPTAGKPPLVQIRRARVCGLGGLLRLQVRLQAPAVVTVRVLNARGARIGLRRLGTLRPGVTNRNLRLPKALGRPGIYRIVVTAKAAGRSGRATTRLTVRRPTGRAGARSPGC